MTPSKRILLSVLIFGFTSNILLLILSVEIDTESPDLISVFWGNFFAFLNLLLGLSFISWGHNKSHQLFLISLFGGSIIRLIIMLVLVLISLKFLELNTRNFIFSLLFFYFFYLIIEIIYIHLKRRK